MKQLLVCFLIVIGIFGYSQDMASPLPTDKDVKIGTLSNGLKYYIKKNTYPENKVELRLVIKAGSILEKDNQRGLAHFLEHMNFNGTKHFPKNKLVDYLQSIGVEFGADLNAYTSFDETVYMLPIPLEDPSNLDKGFLVLEDWAFNALLTDEDIDDERGVILEEKRMGSGADDRMLNKWLPIALKDSRYAERLPIGTDEVLMNFTPDVLRQFHKDWYRPDLMAVVVVGDIDVNDIEKKINSHFAKYQNPANAPERKYYDIPNYTSPNIAVTSDKEAAFPSLYLMFFQDNAAKPMTTVGDYKKHLSERLFSSMLNARFQEIGNQPDPPFNYAFAMYGSFFSDAKKSYNSIVSASEEKMPAAFNTVLAENQRVKEHGFVESELERAKAELLSNMERTYNNRNKTESGRLVEEYVQNFLVNEPIPGIDWEFEMYKKLLPQISVSDVNSLVDKFIKEHNYSVVVMGSSEPLSVANIQDGIAKVKKEKFAAYTDDAAGLVLMENKPKKGKIKKSSYNKDLDYTTLTLKNGITVKYKKTDHKEDEILMKAISYGGYTTVDDATWKKTHFAMDGVSEAGVNGINLTNLEKLLKGKSVRVSPYVSNESEGMNGNSSIKDLETLFQLVNLYFTSVNYDEDAFQSFRQKQEGQYGSIMNMPEFFFANSLNQYQNQNNKRVANIVPLKEDWSYTSYKEAYNLFKERFANPADFTFYFTGSIPESEFKEYVATYLGSLATTKNRETFNQLKETPLTGFNEATFKKGEETKAIVVISNEKEAPYNQDDDLKMKMLGEVLNIVLTEKLREDEGGVYSLRVTGNMSQGVNSYAYVSAYIPTGVDQYKEMRDIALQEMKDLTQKPVSAENLKKVQEQFINNYKDDIQTNRYWQNVLVNSDYWNTDPKEAFTYVDRVKAVTAQDLLATAKKYLNENITIGVLIPEVEQEKMKVASAEVGDMTVDKVIGNYCTAVTGISDVNKAKMKLQSVKKKVSKGLINIQGMEFPFETAETAPHYFDMTLDMTAMGAGKMNMHFGKDGAYREMNDQKEEMPITDDMTSKMGLFNTAFLDNSTAKLLEAQEINGTKYYVLEADGAKYYFNALNYLLDQVLEGQQTTVFSEYKDANGFKVPFKEKITGGDFNDVNYESITIE